MTTVKLAPRLAVGPRRAASPGVSRDTQRGRNLSRSIRDTFPGARSTGRQDTQRVHPVSAGVSSRARVRACMMLGDPRVALPAARPLRAPAVRGGTRASPPRFSCPSPPRRRVLRCSTVRGSSSLARTRRSGRRNRGSSPCPRASRHVLARTCSMGRQ